MTVCTKVDREKTISTIAHLLWEYEFVDDFAHAASLVPGIKIVAVEWKRNIRSAKVRFLDEGTEEDISVE